MRERKRSEREQPPFKWQLSLARAHTGSSPVKQKRKDYAFSSRVWRLIIISPGSGEITQWVRVLGLGSNPQHPCKNQDWPWVFVAQQVQVNSVERGTGKCWLDSLAKMASIRFSGRTNLSKKIRCRVIKEDIHSVSFSGLHKGTYRYINPTHTKKPISRMIN